MVQLIFGPIAIGIIMLASVNCPVASYFLKGHGSYCLYMIAPNYTLSRHSINVWDNTRCYWWYMK